MLCLDRLHLGAAVTSAPYFADVHHKCWAGSRPHHPASRNHGIKAPESCRQGRVRCVVVHASRPYSDSFPDGKKHARRTLLLNYVQDVQPQVMEQFAEQSPPQVVGAMRQTVTNLLGTLPPQFFTVRVHTVGENLAQLMYSVMMTGYMFRNTQYRMELKNTLGTVPPTPVAPIGSEVPSTASQVAAEAAAAVVLEASASVSSVDAADALLVSSKASTSSSKASTSSSSGGSSSRSSGFNPTSSSKGSGTSMDDEEYAPGVQKRRVQGEVLRWHYKNGVEELAAAEYMDMLEAEVASLRQQLAVLAACPPRPPLQQQQAHLEDGRNELLEYLKGLEPHTLQELTAGAGEEVAEAMNTFIHRMMGTEDKEQLRAAASDCTTSELAKLLFWLMVVGYSLRSLEVRFDMERSLDIPHNKELPPGR